MNKIPYAGKAPVHVHKAPHRARGFIAERRTRPKISVAFDPPLFDHIAASAHSRGVSFATVVREIVASAITQEQR